MLETDMMGKLKQVPKFSTEPCTELSTVHQLLFL